MTRLVYVANSTRQCGRCHTAMTWHCGVVGKTAHPIVCYSCIWKHGLPPNWMRTYLDAAEEAVKPPYQPAPVVEPAPDDDIPF